eukprot:4032494-Amphidinium_carterae.1
MSADSSLVEDDENSDPDTSRWQLDSELEDSEPSLRCESTYVRRSYFVVPVVSDTLSCFGGPHFTT